MDLHNGLDIEVYDLRPTDLLLLLLYYMLMQKLATVAPMYRVIVPSEVHKSHKCV